ncbi:3-deoxy-D-manno-octulosonic-acid transferase [Terriglobus roseus]|uniref:3-deoxy-D-manno-octulosonic acid transferase n=2 Tax=Terriglobus roseus TaxID=392734 RepID=A0A1H4PRK4_9BACT|nr:3-deoxy-D-manno-octulosonic-acid transferase [Terriglobus roseus]
MLYSLAVTVALVLSAPVWGWRMLRQGRYRQGLQQRLGDVPLRLRDFVRDRPVLWLHAVSVGETLAATRLIAELEAALPGYAVVISTTTPTGQQVARERFGVDRVFFYPLDLAFAVRPYLRALQPKLVILMESELWPRMLVECERAGVPVAVVNARVSDRSLPRYMRLRVLWKPLLGKLSLLLAQSDEDARRWRSIGAPAERVLSTGNLKYDIRAANETPLTVLVRKHLPADARVLVCGSTHDGEESLLLDCWKSLSQNRVMILAPRHPERTAAVEHLARERGLTATPLSQWRLAAATTAPGAVLLVDTVGELSSLYALATIAFVGGSLIPHGGQNPLEPASFGVPVVMGPSYANFRGMVDAMVQAHAIRMVAREDLCVSLEQLLTTHDEELGERGRLFAASMTGATDRTVAALVQLLERGAR